VVGFPARLAVAIPREPPLDALDILRHVMVRGLERRAICTDAPGRADFVARVAVRAADPTACPGCDQGRADR